MGVANSEESLEAREAHVLRVAISRGFLSAAEAERVLASAPPGQRLATLGARLTADQLRILRAAYASYVPATPPPPARPNDPEGTLAPGAAGAVVESVAPAPRSPSPSGGGRARLPQPGEQVDDYEVLRLLGRGGMGAVYVARDPAGREVALKVHLGRSHERFLIEGEAVARLDHEGIVKIHALGTDQQGRLYCVMGLVAGGSLEAYQSERRPLPLREAVEIALQTARALGYAHAQQILHRDIKPANLLRTPAGRIVITDFGLARVVDQTQQLSQTGQLLGTPAYMSPEQARGEVRTIGPTADVYSLGATLYDLLAERPPFADLPPIQLLLSVANLEPDPPSTFRAEIDPALDAIVLRCLAKLPAERYASMEALAADLEGYLEQGASGVQAYAASRRAPSRTRALFVLLALALSGVAALSARPSATRGPADFESRQPGPLVSPSTALVDLDPNRALRPEGEPLGTLRPGEPLLVTARDSDYALQLSLVGRPGAEVRIEGGGAVLRPRCELGWALPVLLQREVAFRPLRSGTYTLTLAPGAQPVQVGLRRLADKGQIRRALATSELPLPPLELCLRSSAKQERARSLIRSLKGLAALRAGGKKVRASGFLKDLERLREPDPLPLFELLLAGASSYPYSARGPQERADVERVGLQLEASHPDVYAVRWHAARGHFSAGRYEEAARGFARALELKPDRYFLRRILIQSCSLAGQHERALLACRQLLAAQPSSHSGQTWFALTTFAHEGGSDELAELLMLRLKRSKSTMLLKRFLERLDTLFATPDPPASLSALARLYLVQGAQYAQRPYDRQPVLGWQLLVRLRAVRLLQGVEPARRLWKISPQVAKGDAETRARFEALGKELGG